MFPRKEHSDLSAMGRGETVTAIAEKVCDCTC